MINLAVVNHSTVVLDAEAQAVTKSLQQQVQNDLGATWGITAGIFPFTSKMVVPASYWQVLILDDSDQAGALGYHDLTKFDQPVAKVFARTDNQNNLSWSVTASHEVLEMLVDPQLVFTADLGPQKAVALEVGDPVEADRYGYLINGVMVSDFVLPNWFTSASVGKTDFCGHLTKPLTLLPGGYVSVKNSGTWTQIQRETIPGVISRATTSERCAARALANQTELHIN